jgi:hypothetical protein
MKSAMITASELRDLSVLELVGHLLTTIDVLSGKTEKISKRKKLQLVKSLTPVLSELATLIEINASEL